jgi:hypothetical protein
MLLSMRCLVLLILLPAVSCKVERSPPGSAGPVEPPVGILLCRGGPALTVDSKAVFETSGIHTFSTGNREMVGHTEIALHIGKSSVPAGIDGERLAPGSCAYAEHPMAADEPTVLRPPPDSARVTMTWKVEAGVASSPQIATGFDVLGHDEQRVLRATVTRGKIDGTYDVTEYQLR